MRIAIFGATGQLGSSLVSDFATDDVTALRSSDCDIVDYEAVMNTMLAVGPELIVNAAAAVSVDALEQDPDKAFGVNAIGPRNLADAARSLGADLIHVSTDYVFDGSDSRPYDEWDRPNPLSVYARSKYAGEVEVFRRAPGSSVVRTAVVFSQKAPNFALAILNAARSKDGSLQVVGDQIGCPTYAPHLSKAIVELARSRRHGLYHVTGTGACSRADFARALLIASGDDPERIIDVSTSAMIQAYPAPRPADAALIGRAWTLAGFSPLPTWQEAVQELVGILADPGVDAVVDPATIAE